MQSKQNSILAILVLVIVGNVDADEPAKEKPIIRVGIIGLDTSHSIAFAKLLNDPNAAEDVANCPVVAAYPHGSPDIESSVSRIPTYTRQIQELGVEIAPSIDALLEKVDAVLLETNDGRPHLEQVLSVFKAGKRVFIDKPIAASLTDAVAIFEASKKYDVPTFSSSSLRYGRTTQAARRGDYGKITHCEARSPSKIEKTHPDLFWYGIHGVEALFTVMGTECKTVRRSERDGKIEVIGQWSDERTGLFLEAGYGGFARSADGIEHAIGNYDGYRPLIVEIVKYFRTGKVPIQPNETLEIYAFMEAADESKRQGGKEVQISEVLKNARREALKKLNSLGVR
jgi:predicted dehydrogenase